MTYNFYLRKIARSIRIAFNPSKRATQYSKGLVSICTTKIAMYKSLFNSSDKSEK